MAHLISIVDPCNRSTNGQGGALLAWQRHLRHSVLMVAGRAVATHPLVAPFLPPSMHCEPIPLPLAPNKLRVYVAKIVS